MMKIKQAMSAERGEKTGVGMAREIKGGSSGEGLQGEINGIMAGPWGTCEF